MKKLVVSLAVAGFVVGAVALFQPIGAVETVCVECDTGPQGNAFCRKNVAVGKVNCIAFGGSCTSWVDCTASIRISE
jgi:hypothetical protein